MGTLKLDGLAKELPAVSLALHHAVKQATDSHGILNPGRAIPPRGYPIRGGHRRP